jgi:transcription antitermination factor NusG
MIDIVSIGGAPTVVDDALLQNLRSWAGNEIDLITLEPALRTGDQVKILSGPLQGLSGRILKEPDERMRVTILLSFLQDDVHLNVERANIRKIA